jgi:hypothetical protein
MPPLHRWLGNPVLSYLGRRFFGGDLRDFHCGLRGFKRDAVQRLGLVTNGMEFASEMIVKSLQARLRVAEVPTTLTKDGRDRPPHLNTWRDGWRHLRYLLLFSPRWLFLYPGLGLLLLGAAQMLACAVLRPGAGSWPVGIHTQLFAAGAAVLGLQTLLFAAGVVLARQHAGLGEPHPAERLVARLARSAALPLWGATAAVIGLALAAALTFAWGRAGFGALEPEITMRQVIPAVSLMLAGSQAVLASMFFAALRSAFDSTVAHRNASARTPHWQELP